MLTRLRFNNFKAWKDSGEIRLAPLTVLFGANSAGKTSIPQLLLLLKQTADSPDNKRALQFGDSRTLIDLGTYDDALHNHDVSQPLNIDFGWTLESPLTISDPLSHWEEDGNSINFRVSIQAGKRHQPLVGSLEYELLRDTQTVLSVRMDRRADNDRFELSSQGYNPVRHTGRVWPLPEPFRFYGFPDEATAYYQNTAFLSDLVLQLERMLRSVFYVGPLRESPKRLYLWSGEVPDHVGGKGDRAIEAILAAGDRAFNTKAKQKKQPLATLVAERLRSMGLIREFEVKALGDHRKEYEVLVRSNPKLPWVKLTDVGFGVSQVLPVIVECFYVPRRSIVIFEQPEIHLHPKVQAGLADLFVDAIRAREDGVARDCQFIIESHSEHFLRRVQRRIAEGELSPNDTALYFVHTEGDSARIEELKVDLYGNIRNWPEDFFGDEMEDLGAHRRPSEAGILKRQRVNKTPKLCVVDTNVAATANGSNEGATPECVASSARALHAVMESGHVCIDEGGLIVAEYRRNLSNKGEPGPGTKFLRWILTHEWSGERVTRVALTPKETDPEDFDEVPIPTSGVIYDPSDRKFLAVASAHTKNPVILQSFDSKWWGWRDSLKKAGVLIHFLCPDDIARKHREKMGR